MVKLGVLGMKGGAWAVAGSVGAHGLVLAVGLHFASAGVSAAPTLPVLGERIIDVADVQLAVPTPPDLVPPITEPVPSKDSSPPREAAPSARTANAAPARANAASPDSRAPDSKAPEAAGSSGSSGLPITEPSQDKAPNVSALAAEEAPPKFDLPTIGAGHEPGANAGAAGAGNAGSAGTGSPQGDGPLSESAVSARAHLTRGGLPPYPPLARADGVEGDVALELVVSTSGSVESARVVHGLGHGLDEAASTAARGYAFTPAQKDGHAVRVRMIWTMHFRLE